MPEHKDKSPEKFYQGLGAFLMYNSCRYSPRKTRNFVDEGDRATSTMAQLTGSYQMGHDVTEAPFGQDEGEDWS